jgi:hypothetical protein
MSELLDTPEKLDRYTRGVVERYNQEHGLEDPETAPLPGITAKDIKPRVLRWLWEGRIKQGALTTFAADPGVGKSTFATTVLARVITRGEDWPDGVKNVLGPRWIVYVGDEDDYEEIVRPRLDLSGADMSMVRCLTMAEATSALSARGGISGLASALGPLHTITTFKRLQKSLNPALWIIDPFDELVRAPKENSMGGWGQALQPFKTFVRNHDTAIAGIMHMVKDKAGKSATAMSGGSIKFAASTRGSYNVMISPSDPDARIIVPGKPLNQAVTPNNITFKIQSANEDDLMRVLELPEYHEPDKYGEVWSREKLAKVGIVADLKFGGYQKAEDIVAASAQRRSDDPVERYLETELANGKKPVAELLAHAPCGRSKLFAVSKKMGVVSAGSHRTATWEIIEPSF